MTVFEQNNAIENAFSGKVELVAAYVRVSTQEQKLHGISIDAQKSKLQQYADKNNMRIVEWYVDEGVSGRKLIRNRPELQRMIQDAEKGRFTRCLFIRLDRFFRSVAEYHEAMKRMSPVLWTATEEQYDLTTANGRMLVNMKLTVAEMEADQGGERIRIVNDYKTQTGQPLFGKNSMPFGFKVGINEATGRKNVIRDTEEEPILRDALEYFLTHQSKHKTLVYLHAKHHIALEYKSLSKLLTNTMLYGAYRDNPAYCEAYIDKETFDKIQDILQRNVKENTSENRAYIFSGLIKCPVCGRLLKGGIYTQKYKSGLVYFKKYRCGYNKKNASCQFNKVVNEKTLEKLMLANIEKYLKKAKVKAAKVTDAEAIKIPQVNIDDIYAEIDRLNYSWQTGKIRTVEKYEKDYAELMEKLEEAQAEQGTPVVKDFGHIETILQAGWKEIYNELDDAHKRAFWRSFVQSIEIKWTTEKKEVVKVNFF